MYYYTILTTLYHTMYTILNTLYHTMYTILTTPIGGYEYDYAAPKMGHMQYIYNCLNILQGFHVIELHI